MFRNLSYKLEAVHDVADIDLSLRILPILPQDPTSLANNPTPSVQGKCREDTVSFQVYLVHASKTVENKIYKGSPKVSHDNNIYQRYSDLSNYAHIWPTRLPALVFAVKSSKHDDSELNVCLLGRADKHDN